MTREEREEAIRLLNKILYEKGIIAPVNEVSECIKTAIKALEEGPCEDCISRSDAIEVIRHHWEDMLSPVNLRIQEDLKELPSVQTKTGHWYRKYEYGNLYCSKCNHEYLGLSRKPKFCEECGAKMSESEK